MRAPMMRGARIVEVETSPTSRASGCRAMAFLSSIPPTYLGEVEFEAPTWSWSAPLAHDRQPTLDRGTFACPARVSERARCGSPPSDPPEHVYAAPAYPSWWIEEVSR